MNVLIIEDETAAAKQMTSMLSRIDPAITILAVIDSIDDAVDFLTHHDEPDIIFADIQLSDGVCFEIFRQIQPGCAVIFTTAFDEYAVEAFKVNSIDYLLKPIHQEDLKKSLDKYHAMKRAFGSPSPERLTALLSLLDQGDTSHKTRFLVKSGQTLRPVQARDAAYFLIDSQLVFLVTRSGSRFLVEHTLDELEGLLDPNAFFRINRQMIVSLDAVSAIHPFFNSRLSLDLTPPLPSEVLVSRMKVSDFKKWLDR
ncbi:LytTR family DNA-binding domain-containing protein [Desulfatiferula olefinivorans]